MKKTDKKQERMLQNLDWTHALLVRALAITADKRAENYLATLAECPENIILACLQELHSRGLATRCADTGMWHITALGLACAPECCRMLREQCEPNAIPCFLGWLEEESWPAVIDDFLRMLDQRLQNKEACAKHCLELLILFLLENVTVCADDGCNKKKKLLESILLIQILCVSASVHTELAAKLFQAAYVTRAFPQAGEPELYGDFLKNIIDFSFTKGMFSADVLEAHEHLLHNTEDVEDFPARLYALRLAEHGQRLEKQADNSTRVEVHFLNVIALCISQTAMHMRRFSLANGIIRSVNSIAELSGNRVIANLWLSHTAFVQLRQGKFDAALETLDYLSHCAPGNTEPSTAASTARGLALYHYLHNRIEAAYRILSKETALLIQKGIPHVSFLDPLNFDMLYAFELCGYPPVPRYHLDEVTDEILLSSSLLLQGAALRTKAMRLRTRGAPAQSVIVMLHESVAKFHPERDFRDLALTLHELANTLAFTGEYDQAEKIRQRVEGLIGYKLTAATPYRVAVLLATFAAPDLPGVGKPEHHNNVDPSDMAPENAEESLQLLRSCQKELQQLSLGLSFKSSLQRIVQALQHIFTCHTTALFQPLPDGGYACAATASEDTGETLQNHMEECAARISAQASEPHEGVIRRNDTELHLFLETGTSGPWVLSLRFTDANAVLLRSTPVMLQLMATSLTTEVRTLLRLHQEHEKKRHLRGKTPEEFPQGKKELDKIVGNSMLAMLHEMEELALSDAPVLILGETGVGKEVVARHLHRMSGRAGSFVAIHPASTTETLFESEFFGHERGAFTGASGQRSGYFEIADKGTLFIDEVGDIPLAMQTKLLRVLQDQTFMRVGSSKVMCSNFRLITATNKDLAKEGREGRFREDFFYRVAVALCTIPPLRERKQDITSLTENFMVFFARRYNRTPLKLTEKQMRILMEYPWPGNVRELKSVVERMVIGNGFSEGVLWHNPLYQNTQVDEEALWTKCTQDFPSLEEVERRYLRSVLKRAKGRIRGEKGVATLLGMKESTLYAKLKRHGLHG